MIEHIFIMGLNAKYNVDAVSSIPNSILTSDLLSKDSPTIPAYSEQRELEEPTVGNRKRITTLKAEIWNISGCAPVIRLRLFSEDFVLPIQNPLNAELTQIDCDLLLTSMFDDLEIPVNDRSIQSAFKKQDLPFLYDGDNTDIAPEGFGDSELKSLTIPITTSQRGDVAALAYSQTSDDEFEKGMSAIVLVGIQAQRARLNRQSAIWVDGPSSSEDEETADWHRSGTRILQETGLANIASRTLTLATNHWAESASKEFRLAAELLGENSVLVPAIQHAKHQERIGSIENDKLRKRQEEEDQKTRREQLQAKENEQAAEIYANRERGEKRSKRLVTMGSIIAFVITAVSLVPAIGSIDPDSIPLVAGPDWAWRQTGLIFLIIGPIALFALIFLNYDFWYRIKACLTSGRRSKASRESSHVDSDKNLKPKAAEDSKNTRMSSLNQDPNAQTDVKNVPLLQEPPAPIKVARSKSNTAPKNLKRESRNAENSNSERTEHTPSHEDSNSSNADSLTKAVADKSAGTYNDDVYRYRIRTRVGTRADAMLLLNQKVRVRQGALARAVALPSTTEPILALRDELLAQKILVDSPYPNLLQLASDYDFQSFSQAAGVILGRSTTGIGEWSEETETEAERIISVDDSTEIPDSTTSNIFVLKSGNSAVSAKATYNVSTKRMLVLKGSTARYKMTASLQSNYRIERTKLEQNNIFKLSDESTHYTLLQDYEFNSPSMAASVMLGRSTNGKYAWECESTDLSLGEVLLSQNKITVEPGEMTDSESKRPISHNDEGTIWALAGAGDVKATGRYLDDRNFLVFAGSVARMEEKPSTSPRNRRVRKTLINDGTFIDCATHYRLSRDLKFDSPSQAAGVFLGRSANGLTEWKDGERPLSEAIEDIE